MKTALNLFFILIFLTSFGQKEIGIGIVSVNFDDKTVIEFYKSSDLINNIETVEFFNDESIKSWNIKELENHKEWLSPESMWLDYGQFRFRCKTKMDTCFEIYVNETQTMWIEKQDFIEFKNWEAYLKSMFMVERANKTAQKIYSKPSINSEMVKSENDCFSVIQMQGKWIEVETAEHCETVQIITGWIQWRDGNTILINYYTTS